MFGKKPAKLELPCAHCKRLEQQLEHFKREHVHLANALTLMGFDPRKVIEQLEPEGDRMWRELPFLLSRIEFDMETAHKFRLSKKGIEYGISALDRVSHEKRKAPELTVAQPVESVRSLYR
jgi:hypothetical protein